ncbi:bifunctional DedA family/phosphatase PAP2 family protein [Clostridium grantii]|uniref:Membrane protein DedA, SNARE-associated domain n=1 Tax=Clostridium grantii DSM 8605 TaxID=1121316 RepID=A0A1M5WX23_9CLOT|nr:bifunctional DedA family/phosphatase PAP2 family protein [Clostridium grantii]SHH92255.1 membrane protein DedA, SNARE-associated domain [Clostridium grantii DSM 8605]
MNYIIQLLNDYGYIVLLVALMLELIALPLPGEALMTYCGYIIYQHKMNWPVSILVAATGTIIGITLSYYLGSLLGLSFFEKYGHYVHLNKKRLEKISNWFDKYGNKLLVIAYFIPGVRHITGYFSGITKISYKKFAVHSYVGAILWTGTFISLGKILGSNWEKYHNLIKKYLIIGSLIITFILMFIWIYKAYKVKIYESTFELLDKGLVLFHSLGKIKIIIAGIAVAFLGFSLMVVGIIQDYLAAEFNDFDEIVRFLVSSIFTEKWAKAMQIFGNASNSNTLILVVSIIVIWILVKGCNKIHELKFLGILLFGTEILNYVLKVIFHRLGPTQIGYTFPSSESLTVIVVYGFIAYIIPRYSSKAWINTIIIGASLAICILSGLSMIYFNFEYPSDVVAGYAFGGVWLSLNIILLEVYRILPKLKFNKN